jgi:hypothetical protein
MQWAGNYLNSYGKITKIANYYLGLTGDIYQPSHEWKVLRLTSDIHRQLSGAQVEVQVL